MLRHEIVQRFLDCYPNPDYLEVGVASGGTFHKVQAGRKVAVDPRFKFDPVQAATEHPSATYHQVTSDAYFSGIIAPAERFDVVFLDGLHTFEQTLRDLLNTLPYVHEKSVIVIDDVIPRSYIASLPSLGRHLELRKITKDPSAQWMGDVYRLVFFISEFVPQYRFATVEDSHGVLVMWRGARDMEPVRKRGVEAIARMDYGDFLVARAEFNAMPLAAIAGRVQEDLGLTPATAAS